MTSVLARAAEFLSMAVKKATEVASSGKAVLRRKASGSKSTASRTRKSSTKTGPRAPEQTQDGTDSSEEALWTSATKSLPMMTWDLRPTKGPIVKMRGKEVILVNQQDRIKLVRNEDGAWEPSDPERLNYHVVGEFAKALDALYDKYVASMVVM